MPNQDGARKRPRLARASDTLDILTVHALQKGLNNNGAGAQHSNFGAGNQNNNSGFGTQYNANSINFVNKEKDNFLADLRVTDPRDDKTRIERTKGNLLKDSYRWILEHDDFCGWRAEKRLLWIKGSPGKGKTMLLCGIIDELIAMGHKSTFFFFCQATDARLNTATSVLRGLLYLVLVQNPCLLDRIRDEYDQVGKQLFEDVNSWDVLCRMLLLAVSHESLHGVILVIDALDECTSGLDQLLSFIIDLTAHAKIIVSSRLWLSIDRGLAAALEDTKIYLSLELNEEVISTAVDNYIKHKVYQLASVKRYDDQTELSVQRYLAENASSTFLWVALVYDQLADNRVSPRHTQQKLQEFPPGLDSLYDKILTQVLGLLDAKDCAQVLAVMASVSRPLDVAELASILDQVQYLEEIIEECGSLLTMREGTIYFIHQSAKDFLLRQANRIMPWGIAHNHNLILSKLLQSMSNKLRRNMYDIDQHGIPVEDICVPSPDPLWSLRYACVYWVDHLIDETTGDGPLQEVYSFIRAHFLHWLEALSLLRSISEGISSLCRILSMINASAKSPEGGFLVQDALRFIRYFRQPIELDPTQIYLSALVFSPKGSIIRQLFRSEEPKWPLKPEVDDDWGPCILTLEGHKSFIHSLDFSSDQTMLASASSDHTVRLWNTTTGHCVRTLETDGAASSVAFSIDGITLAVASDFSIELWNTISGRRIRTISDISHPFAVVFSHDGAMLASGSRRGVVQLWDVQSGQCTRTFTGHHNNVLSVTFSADDSLIASGSRDNTVKLWQTATGICQKTIEHVDPVISVEFSGDNTHLACVTYSEVIVYDLITGAHFHPHKAGVNETLETVAISRDGKRLAFDTTPTFVQVWDMTTKKPTRILQGHSKRVTSVTFSKDGTLLASASYDASIKLWDLTTDRYSVPSCIPEPESNILSNQISRQRKSHRFVVSRKALSSAKGRRRKAPVLNRLHEVTQNTHESHNNERIHSITFSCDGSSAISLSSSRTCIWDMKTGWCTRTICDGDLTGSNCSATIFDGNLHVATRRSRQIELREENSQTLHRIEVYNDEEGLTAKRHEGPSQRDYVYSGTRPLSMLLQGHVQWVQFSNSGFELLTNLGTIDLNAIEKGPVLVKPKSPRDQDPTPKGYAYVRENRRWILKDGKRYLWLPTDYRPSMSNIYGSMIAMGFDSGRVTIMRLS